MTAQRPLASTSDLLSIDVAAELRKVSGLALEGPWQIPSVLVRWAVARGARRAEVRLRRRTWQVSTDALLAPEHVALLRTVLDTHRADLERHAAFVALERSTSRELACLASCQRGALSVSRGGSTAGRTLLWRPGSKIAEQHSSRGSAGTRFELRGVSSNRARAADWVRDVARFADIEVSVDGAPVPRGFRETLGTRVLAPPLEGRASLSPGEDGASVWLLHRGAAVARLTLAEAPASEVALELGGAGCGPTPAALREAALPLTDDLIGQLVDLLIARGRRLGSLPPAEQITLRRQLLRSAVFRRAPSRISELRIIPALEGPARQLRLFSLAELEETAAERGSLGFVSPGGGVAGLVAGSAPLVVLDAVERARLARRTGLRLVPPARQAPLPLRERLARRLLRSWRGVRASLDERRPEASARSLSPAALRRLEGAFRGAIRCHDGPRIQSVRLVRGAGPASVSATLVILPLDNPLAAKSLRLLKQGRSFETEAVLALGQGELLATPRKARRSETS